MTWPVWLLIAYFLIAITSLADRIVVAKEIDRPAAYSFLVAALGSIVIFLAPFGFYILPLPELSAAFLAGGITVPALYYLYRALKHGQASAVFPFIGSISTIGIFVLSYFFLHERLNSIQISGVVLLLIGSYIVSREVGRSKGVGKPGSALLAGIFLAVTYTAAKYVYNGGEFIAGLIWIRLFAFLVATLILLSPKNRRALKALVKPSRGDARGLILLGQGTSAIGFLILNYTISLVSVTIVSAAIGLQYVYILILGLILRKKYPKLLPGKLRGKVLGTRIVGIAVVIVGLILVVS